MKKLLSIGIILLFIGMSISSSTGFNVEKQSSVITLDGKTLYVGGSGPGNYSKIQDAIDDVVDGDTVFVYDDSSPYYENVVVNKSINLIGENRETTVIIGWCQISADWVNFNGFKFGYFQVYYILIKSSYNKISNNNFLGNQNTYVGIELSNDCNYNIISDNIFDKLALYSIHISDNCTDTIIINNTFLNDWHDIVIENYCHNTTIIGNKILGTGCCAVIDISLSNNNTIKDNYISPYKIYGIELRSSHNNTVKNNTISGNKYICGGIELINSKNNNIFDNSMFRSGFVARDTSQNIVINNTVNNKSLVYIESISDSIIPSNAGQVVLIDCNNITIENQELSNTIYGIELWESTNCTIFNCIISDNHRGIKFYNSYYNKITANNINKNEINFYKSHYNIISDNNISNKFARIKFYKSKFNTIIDNIITNNRIGSGIELEETSNENSIISNLISNHEWYGIEIQKSSNNNIIYHNNFLNNKYNAKDGCNNIWDDGKYGNYWDDYEERYPNASKKWRKGIWDTPYEIHGGDNKDRCPLIKQWPDSKPRTISRNTASYSSYLLRLLERFPILQKILQHEFRI